jgi:hypothetical protein
VSAGDRVVVAVASSRWKGITGTVRACTARGAVIDLDDDSLPEGVWFGTRELRVLNP